MRDTSFKRRVSERLPFLGNAGTSIHDEFYARAIPAKLDTGTFIRMEGDECTNFALVLDGVARVYKSGPTGREITLYRIEPGEGCVLTASCIVGEEVFPAFAVAETDVFAAVVPASDFRRWVRQYPEWQTFVFRLVSGRLVNVITVVEEVAFLRLDARIAAFLLGADIDADRVVHTTHDRIADELGSSREVVSRVLKEMENSGAIALSRGKITLIDERKLGRIGSGVF